MKKIIVNPKIFYQALSIVHKAVTKQSMVVILENFLFEVSDKKLKISATDLSTSLSVTMNIESPPAVWFNAVVPVEIMKYVKKLDEPIVLQWTEESYSLEILEEDGRSKYSGENAGDYPRIYPCESKVFNHDTTLFETFGEMLPYVSGDQLRPAMCSIAMVYRNGRMELCGTDGHKLLIIEVPSLNNPECSDGELILIESRAARLLSSFNFRKVHSNLSCYFNENRARYRFSFEYQGFQIDLTGRNVDERYPSYWEILPTSSTTKYTIDRYQFFKCLDKAMLFAHPSTHCVQLHLNGSNKMESSDLDLSKEFSAMIGGTLEGDQIRIGFNGELLKEVIETFENNVTLEMVAPNRAMLIRSGLKTALLMPIQLPPIEVEEPKEENIESETE